MSHVEAAVRIENVSCEFASKRTRVLALRNVSFDVLPGELVTIVGPSGCGKSTLLKIVAGLVRTSCGEVRLLGDKVHGPQDKIGFVFQRPNLLPWRTVWQNILLQAEMRNMGKAIAVRRANELIEMVGLRGFEQSLPHELSGGMQQRVSLCRALLHRPPVLLMDEPFGSLDSLTREQLNVELNRIWQETSTSMLFVTHSITEAVYLGTRVVVMTPRPGRIAAIVEVDSLATSNYAEAIQTQAFGQASQKVRSRLRGEQGGADGPLLEGS